MEQLRRKTRRALAGEIAEAIDSSQFRAGEWLRQIDLEEKFGATRFEVRTALDELVILKKVEHVPNRGYRVTELDAETLRSIRAVRVMLETAAAPAIIARVTASDIARLKELAQEFSAAVKSGTRLEHSRVNGEFHHLIYGLCGNPVQEELIWSLRDRARNAPITVWNSHDSLARSAVDHFEIVAALEKRDADALAAVIRHHILKDFA